MNEVKEASNKKIVLINKNSLNKVRVKKIKIEIPAFKVSIV